MKCVIGIDFDNTLANYDRVIRSEVFRRGWTDFNGEMNKRCLRDRIRQLPRGEARWQEIQGVIYGQRIDEAELMEGALEFFHCCRRQRDAVEVYVVSHKTAYAVQDPTRTNLHHAAFRWMRRRGFFDKGGLDLNEDHVYFEKTRQEKIRRLSDLRCTHFIDDLEETFLEQSFPPQVQKILYAPGLRLSRVQGVTVAKGWREIQEHVFGKNN